MDREELNRRFWAAQGLVREAGQRAADLFRRRDELVVERKGRQDFVSRADKEAEDFVMGEILRLFPEDGFLGEEGGARQSQSGATWIIDPIDGTSNFLAGVPVWCVSLGLVENANSVLGVIYNPVTDEFYAAQTGGGATLNGKKIRASQAAKVDEARIMLGFSYRRPVEEHVKAVDACLNASCEYARFGSGALGLAYAADGRFDGYFEAHINAWDVAAGLVIVQEAGGWHNDFFGPADSFAKGNVILAAAPGIAKGLSDLLL
jgi:myo-inositol-1(or 4)-monophosphatase